MLNPLLTDYQLPPFTRIRPEHAEPAVRTLLDGVTLVHLAQTTPIKLPVQLPIQSVTLAASAES